MSALTDHGVPVTDEASGVHSAKVGSNTRGQRTSILQAEELAKEPSIACV